MLRPAALPKVITLLTIATVANASLAQAQSERSVMRGSSVALYNIAGRLTVEAGSGSDVVIEVTRRGRDASRLRIETGERDGRNALRVLYPDDDIVYTDRESRWGRTELRVHADGTWGGDRRWNEGRRVRVSSRGSGTEAWADIRVLVPAGKSFDAHLGVGEMTATNVRGSLRLDSGSGRLTATGIRGTLSVDVGSGGADVRDVDVDLLDIDSGSGGIRLTDVVAGRCNIDSGSGGVTGEHAACRELHVDVGSGGVRVADIKSNTVRIDAGSGAVQLSMNDSPSDVSIESGSGGVVLGLPASLSAELDIETGSGSIDSDFPVRMNRMERHRLRGTVGEGAGRIRIETGSGSVKLRKN